MTCEACITYWSFEIFFKNIDFKLKASFGYSNLTLLYYVQNDSETFPFSALHKWYSITDGKQHKYWPMKIKELFNEK